MRPNYPSSQTLFEATAPLVLVDESACDFTDFTELDLWYDRNCMDSITEIETADDLLRMPQVVPEFTHGRLS